MRLPGRRDRLAELERRLVWIVGSPRTGTTWLMHLLQAHTGAVCFDEPQLGTHLVLFTPDLLGVPAEGFPEANLLYNDWRRSADDYFFSDRYAPVWEPALRRMVLERFAAQVADSGADPGVPVVIKEPNGSQAMPLLRRLLPQSRLLVVWRDGRDVVDSQLDASRKGSWMDVVGGGREMTPQERSDYLAERAMRWVARTRAVQSAYDAHAPALRLAVTYEELLAEPVPRLTDIGRWLGARPVVAAEGAVRSFDFDRISPSDKGSGRFARAATPGLWREHFTPAEVGRLEGILGPTLRSLGYE